MTTCRAESNLNFSGEMMLVAVATMFSVDVMRVCAKVLVIKFLYES
jgi:hypothetical protein